MAERLRRCSRLERPVVTSLGSHPSVAGADRGFESLPKPVCTVAASMATETDFL